MATTKTRAKTTTKTAPAAEEELLDTVAADAAAELDEEDTQVSFTVDGHEYTFERAVFEDADFRRLLRNDNHEEALYQALGSAQWEQWLARTREADKHNIASIEAYARLVEGFAKAAKVGNS